MAKSNYTPRPTVSAARLHQPATGRPIAGVAKINHGNGTFSMKVTGKK